LKTEHKVIVLAAMLGLLMWVIDAILDSFIFKNTLLESLITDVPHHELYMRSVVIGCFLIFGVIASRIIMSHSRAGKLSKEREQMNELLMDSLPHFAMITRKDRTVLLANRIAQEVGAKVGGYCWRDFGGSEFVPEQDRIFINDHNKIPPGGTHCRFCLADEALESQRPIRNPELNAWGKIWDTHWVPLTEDVYLHYAIDVTELKQSEKELRKSEEKFRNIYEESPIGIELYDSEGQLLDVNESCLDIFGLSNSAEVKGFKLFEYPNVPDEVRERLCKGEMVRYEVPFDFEAVKKRKLYETTKSGICHLDVLITPLGKMKENETQGGYLVQVRDISERKQAEKELKKAHDKLEKRVKERTAELVTANEKLKQEIEERKRADELLKTSLREKEVLLQEIHHRVKNNLQLISSLLDMSSMRIHEQQAIDLLNDARDKIHSMALIHIQLYQSEKFDQIEMGNHIRELIDYLSMLYSTGKVITTIVDVSNVYLSITQAIPCALVLNELISNAFKHAFKERQGGNIAISMQRASDDTISIGVKDDGIGIPNEVDIYETNSLGLKLVRNLVQKQLKGTIELSGTNGTEFIIEFKAQKQHI